MSQIKKKMLTLHKDAPDIVKSCLNFERNFEWIKWSNISLLNIEYIWLVVWKYIIKYTLYNNRIQTNGVKSVGVS